MTTRGRAKPVRKTGNTWPVDEGGICTPSAAARVGATSCCTAGVEYVPVLTAGPANISGIATSYVHGEPCIYATSAREMKSPSRGTIRSWPVRPGKYARANISKKRCRVARVVASAGAACWIRGASLPIDRLTCWLDTVQLIATRVRVIAIRAVGLQRVVEFPQPSLYGVFADPMTLTRQVLLDLVGRLAIPFQRRHRITDRAFSHHLFQQPSDMRITIFDWLPSPSWLSYSSSFHGELSLGTKLADSLQNGWLRKAARFHHSLDAASPAP